MSTPRLHTFFTLPVLILLLLVSGAASAKTPIVFVHGYAGWGGNFAIMASHFKRDGWTDTELYQFSYNSLLDSDVKSAQKLADFVNYVRARTQSVQVDIIAHSNGGLVTRYYKNKLGGYRYIDDFVTLGTPHKGTYTALLCFSPACKEMRPGSDFLDDLGGGCDYSIWSSCDEIINPDTHAQCGTSIKSGCVEHAALLIHGTSYTLARERVK